MMHSKATEQGVGSYKIPVIIFFLSVCSALFSDLYVPSLPVIASYFQSSINFAQETITYSMFGFALGQFIYGPISDRYGRRKVMIVALFVAVLASAICMMANTIFTLLMGRFLQGIGVAACLSLPRAILRDNYSGKQMAKIVSAISVCVELVITCSPVIGGYLALLAGWRGNFYFLFSYVLVAILIVYGFLPETNKGLVKISRLHLQTQYKRLLTDKRFLGYSFVSGMAYALLMIYFLISPFVIQNNLHFTVSQYGLLTLLISAMLVVGAAANGYLVSKWDINQTIAIGISLIILSSAGMLFGLWYFGETIYLIIIPSMLAIIGSAFLFSNCSAGALRELANIAGIASSVYSGLQIISAFSISYLVSFFGLKTALSLAWIYSLIGLLTGVIYWIFIREDNLTEGSINSTLETLDPAR